MIVLGRIRSNQGLIGNLFHERNPVHTCRVLNPDGAGERQLGHVHGDLVGAKEQSVPKFRVLRLHHIFPFADDQVPRVLVYFFRLREYGVRDPLSNLLLGGT